MRKITGILVLLVSAGLYLTSAPAQESSGGNIFTRFRQFRIPFNPGSGGGRLKQLQLFVSLDQGRTWQPSATAGPDQKDFKFVTDRDGLFWFTVQTQDVEGRAYPTTLEGAAPSLKVVIDTQPPKVAMQPLAPRGGEVGISWDIQDENLDLSAADAVKLEYRPSGGAWLAVNIGAGANQAYWNPQNNGPLEVRLRARDRAGNQGEASTTLNANSGGFTNNNAGAQANSGQGFVPQQTNDQQHIFNGPTEGERSFVKSLGVRLNYEIKNKGPSGVSLVELWYTQDGRTWNKYLEDSDQNNIVFNVKNEGVYGVTLLAKSGVGLGDRPRKWAIGPRCGSRWIPPSRWCNCTTFWWEPPGRTRAS